MNYSTFIKTWKISKTVLAEKMGMNAYTFKMKLLETNESYKFTEAEELRLISVLHEMGGEALSVKPGLKL